MSTKKKKRIKIKKKNFTIFILIIILIIFSIVKTTNFIIDLAKKPKEDNKVKENIKVKEQNKEIKEKDKKLETLENIDKKIDYFNYNSIDRYINYKKKNQQLSTEQIIKNVNMNLDLRHYKDIYKAKNLNKEIILVNKYYYLEKDYVPDNLKLISNQYSSKEINLVSYAKEAFENLSKAAKKENLNVIAMSGYRSYNYQVNLYNKYVKEDGAEAADTYSGRPGHSEHQTGLAVDVYNKKTLYTNFEQTKEFIWMQNHAHEYGFILRFPKGKEDETGYEYESWHYRYVGLEIAKYIHDNKITLEEYYATKIKDW